MLKSLTIQTREIHIMTSVQSVVKSIQEQTNKPPCKKAIQKMIYLIQESHKSDTQLGFDYRVHLYGPYSSELDAEIRYLCSTGDLSLNETHGGHMLSVESNFDVPSVPSDVREVISNFKSKSPSQLELLTTALYVQRVLNCHDLEPIEDGIRQIKGQKYSAEDIKSAIHELVENRYFSIAS